MLLVLYNAFVILVILPNCPGVGEVCVSGGYNALFHFTFYSFESWEPYAEWQLNSMVNDLHGKVI